VFSAQDFSRRADDGGTHINAFGFAIPDSESPILLIHF
jgi:hypothetical protein